MNKTHIFVLAGFASLILAVSALAEDIYVAQTAQGSGTGVDCSNGLPIEWLNQSYNWGDGTGKVGSGDTVHLCGSFTSTLSVAGSGSAGSPVKILFEDGAKFSKAYWGTGNRAAIYMSGKSNIIIDGGTNGVIECTDNGTKGSYGNQQSASAVTMNSTNNNIEIKNLKIRNLYVRTANSLDFTDAARYSIGIQSGGGNNLSVHDCTLTYIPYFFYFAFPTGTSSNWQFYNNKITHGHTGFVFADGASGAILHDIELFNNTINLGEHWSFSDNSDRWHAEIIHTWTMQGGGSRIYDFKIYNNTFGPQTPMKASQSATTAWLSFTDNTDELLIYNNLFISDPGYYPTDGIIQLNDGGQTMSGHKVYNNVFDLKGRGSAVYITSPQPDFQFKNNIVMHANYVILNAEDFKFTNNSQCDYNVYYDIMIDGWPGGTWSGVTWSSWRAKGGDAHGSNGSEPSLDGNYKPTLDDLVVIDKAISLTSYFTTDMAGETRNGAWDIGAFEAGDKGVLPTISPSPENLRVVK
jgi:hypothetical protein